MTDPRLAQVKPGDTVMWNDQPDTPTRSSGRVVAVYRGIVVVDELPGNTGRPLIDLIDIDRIILPDPLKAQPGVVYRHRDAARDIDDRVGTVDGRLFDPAPSVFGQRYIPFDAD
jgi:hypothetical protein